MTSLIMILLISIIFCFVEVTDNQNQVVTNAFEMHNINAVINSTVQNKHETEIKIGTVFTQK